MATNKNQKLTKEQKITEEREREKFGNQVQSFYASKAPFLGDTALLGTAILLNGELRLIYWDQDYCCAASLTLCNIKELSRDFIPEELPFH